MVANVVRDGRTLEGGAAAPAKTAVTHSLLDAPADAPLRDRILGATLRCIGRWGVAKTTLDDIARAAGCSRATVYRAFPGGKDVLLHEAATHEILAFFAEVAADLAVAGDLADALTQALVDATRRLRRHDALQYLVAHEPGVILPYTTFDGIQPLLDLSAETVAPLLAPHLPAGAPLGQAAELSEWLVRVVLSYAFEDDPVVDLTDGAATRRFVTTFALPGVGVATSIDLTSSTLTEPTPDRTQPVQHPGVVSPT